MEVQANPEDPEKATTFMLVNPQGLLLKYSLKKHSINKKKWHYKLTVSGRANVCGGAAIFLVVFSIFAAVSPFLTYMCLFTLLLLKKARFSGCPDIKGKSFKSRVFYQPEINQSWFELIRVV